jgi:arylsulfatase A-like enzyme
MKAAEAWLERHYEEKFFLYVDTWDPHEPWDAPEFYTKLYDPKYDGRRISPSYARWRDAGLTEADVATAHDTYCGEISMVDRWVGGLLSKIDVLGLRDSTLVIFMSDHGFYFGEHEYFGKADWTRGYQATLPDAAIPDWMTDSWFLTLNSSPLYQELTRIPLVIRAPGVPAGRRSALTTTPDVTATILDIAGVEQVSGSHGRSLRPVLMSRHEALRDFVVSSWPLYFAQGEVTSAIDSKPRRIESYMPLTVSTQDCSLVVGGPDQTPEFYDLSTDPRELVNVWSDRSRDGVSLLEEALEFLERVGTPDAHTEPRRQAMRV